MQFVDLASSSLSGAISRIPKNELDFDPDWEIDPREIVLMDKLGALIPFFLASLFAPPSVCQTGRSYQPSECMTVK